MRRGKAISTRQTGTPRPFFGMLSAMMMPSGISMARMIAEKIRLRVSASQNRSEVSTSTYQSVPAQKNSLLPKVSCTE
ncbi:hypothetical protein D3C72_2284020 [compost metagenome]